MKPLPRSFLWNRLDEIGTDIALVGDHADRLTARGDAIGAGPVPYVCRYELSTEAGFATTSLLVQTEGAGWQREVRLERTGAQWRVIASEQGKFITSVLPGIEDAERLNDVLDVDLDATALTNTLPIRRLGLLGAAPGTVGRIAVAWVRVPSLRVFRAEQTYTVLATGSIRYSSESFTADLTVDADGFVIDYPGYTTRVI